MTEQALLLVSTSYHLDQLAKKTAIQLINRPKTWEFPTVSDEDSNLLQKLGGSSPSLCLSSTLKCLQNNSLMCSLVQSAQTLVGLITCLQTVSRPRCNRLLKTPTDRNLSRCAPRWLRYAGSIAFRQVDVPLVYLFYLSM